MSRPIASVAGRLIGAARWLVLVSSRWVAGQGIRPRTFAALALVAGALMSLCLPPPELIFREGSFRIEALGTRSDRSNASEVWISRVVTDGKALPLNRWLGLPRGWEMRGSMAVSFRHQPATLDWSGSIEPGSQLVLLTHSHSGKARVTIAGQSREYDLYSSDPQQRELVIDLTPAAAAGARFHWNSLVELIVSAVALTLAAAALVAASARAARVLESGWTNAARTADCDPFGPGFLRRALLLSAPSIVTFGASLLAFWPGQMSPDSIGQWREATIGPLTDGFSLPHSTFIWLMARIWPSPALAVGVQALLLALSIGFTLAELRNWRVPRPVLIGASVVMALWPANMMLATVLWKDVLFAGGATLALGASMMLVRTRGTALRSPVFALLLVASMLLVALMRVNMLPATLVIAPALVALYGGERWFHRLRVALPIVLVPWLIKLVVIPAAGIEGLGAHYRAINAVHVIGAYAKADAITAPADRQLAERVMPLDKWRSAYDCQTVLGLFFPQYVNRAALTAEYAALNRMALRLIVARPGIFLVHQACATTLLWRITHDPGLMFGVAPLEIYDMPEGRLQGLVMQSKFPRLMGALRTLRERTVLSRWGTIYWRPALPLFFLTILVGTLMITMRRLDVGLIALPAWLNTASLAALIGAPDYRYQFAVVLAALLTVPILFVRAYSQAARPPAHSQTPTAISVAPPITRGDSGSPNSAQAATGTSTKPPAMNM